MGIGTWKKDITITFIGANLEVVPFYKYLSLEYDDNCNWNSCVDKLVVRGMHALYSMHNNLAMELEIEEANLQNISANNDFVWLSCLGSDIFQRILEESWKSSKKVLSKRTKSWNTNPLHYDVSRNKYISFRSKRIMPIYYTYYQNKAHGRNIPPMQENIESQCKDCYRDRM